MTPPRLVDVDRCLLKCTVSVFSAEEYAKQANNKLGVQHLVLIWAVEEHTENHQEQVLPVRRDARIWQAGSISDQKETWWHSISYSPCS